MELKARIRRRQRTSDDSPVVLEYDAVSPVAHVEEPTGRGPVMERILDYLDPVFDRRLPPNAYVWGPGGTGKSAVVTALFATLDKLLSRTGSVIHTTTRARQRPAPEFVYVDARTAGSDFTLYHAVLDALVDESVPKQGIRTESLVERLEERLAGPNQHAVVGVDHVGEPNTVSLSTLSETFEPMAERLTWVAIGRTPPEEFPTDLLPPERIEFPAYRQHALVDLLTSRASDGLARQSFEHEQIRRIADWAEGDAHDGLAALFGAADVATTDGHDSIRERDLDAGMNAVPRPSVSLGRVLTLPENRQLVLRTLIDLSEDEATSVSDAAAAIADSHRVDLSSTTVTRYLYELAEVGITDRVASKRPEEGAGRPPSRLEPRFPTLVFRRLYDLQHD